MSTVWTQLGLEWVCAQMSRGAAEGGGGALQFGCSVRGFLVHGWIREKLVEAMWAWLAFAGWNLNIAIHFAQPSEGEVACLKVLRYLWAALS